MSDSQTKHQSFSLIQLQTDSESEQMDRSNRIRSMMHSHQDEDHSSLELCGDNDIWHARRCPTVGFSRDHFSTIHSQPSSKVNCWNSFIDFLGGKQIVGARWALFTIALDWFIDFSVGAYHLVNERWLAGGLTFLIVFGAGFIVTFANFSPQQFKSSEVKREIWKMSKFYGILMYIPSFYPICTYDY